MAEVILAGDFKNGVTVEYQGNIWTIIEFQHVKPGKGSPFVRTKLKNIKTGGVIETSFRPTEKLDRAHIERKSMEYLYNDGTLFYFMDPESYEQLGLNEDQLGNALKFVKENDSVTIMSHNGEVFGVEPPNFVELEVTHTEPGARGDTATNVMKPATVETGAEIAVPLFINIGDKIKIDTRSEEYLGRA
ncbi:MAG: elongation factor P [Clostridiales bacterium]|nr:elongation factor P [Bacillota bacterium]MCR5006419.1 elongation factor P [Clostridiales bacterium]